MLKRLTIGIAITILCVIPFYNIGDTHSERPNKNGRHHDQNRNSGSVPKTQLSRQTTQTQSSTIRATPSHTKLNAKQGEQPYILTKIEWLEVRLNSIFRRALIDHDQGIFTSYRALTNDTIIIYIDHINMSDEDINIWANKCKETVISMAKGYGWDNWIKTKVEISHLEL